MHPYNTFNVPQINCKTRLQLKNITITNIWHSTPISTFDALSKWHEPHTSKQGQAKKNKNLAIEPAFKKKKRKNLTNKIILKQ